MQTICTIRLRLNDRFSVEWLCQVNRLSYKRLLVVGFTYLGPIYLVIHAPDGQMGHETWALRRGRSRSG